MSAPTPNPALDDELRSLRAAGRRTQLIWIGVVLAGVLAFGVFTWMLGVGPFAYRVILYERSDLYILNMTDGPVQVVLDGGEPIEVPPQDARRTPITGGTTRVVTLRPEGSVLEEVEVEVDGAPALYSVSGAQCMALSDVSSFYLPGREKHVKVLERYPEGTRVVNLPNDRVIWPRKTLRDEVDNAREGVAWIELVACPLLSDEEGAVLEAHLDVLLTERKKKEKEEEIKRKMAREGGDAVDRDLVPHLDGPPDAGEAPVADAAAADTAAGADVEPDAASTAEVDADAP